MKKRLTRQFLLQHFGLIFLFVTIMIVSIVLIVRSVLSQELAHDFLSVQKDYLQSHMEINEENIEMDSTLRDVMKETEGWLQVINGDGDVVSSADVPADVQTNYSVNDLHQIKQHTHPTSYTYKIWNMENEYLVLYGTYSAGKELLSKMNHVDDVGESESVLKEQKGWYLIYDDSGKLNQTYQFPHDTGAPAQAGTWLHKDINSGEYNVSSKTLADGELLVVGVPNPSLSSDQLDIRIGGTVFGYLVLWLVSTILLIWVLSKWYSKKWLHPFLHLVDWIENLSNHTYEQPKNDKKQTLFKKKDSKVFAEIFTSLRNLTQRLDDSQKQQDELETMREQWIAGLSHDLKTPLSSIKGYAVLLETPSYQWKAEDITELGSIIHRKTNYIQELMDDLSLTYTLKHTSSVEMNSIPVAQQLKQVVVDFLNNPNRTNHSIEFVDHSDAEFYTLFNRKWFKRIIDNLLINAEKFSQPEDPIKVTLEDEADHFSIHIEDQGMGMDETTQRNLFNRYYRGGASTSNNIEGSGLGLAITKQLVEHHQGHIRINSELDVGTTISLHFPKAA